MGLKVWRYPIETVYRTIGPRHALARVAYVPNDYFEWPMSFDNFGTGPSDYDTPSDEAYCPCGAELPWREGTLGDLLRVVLAHCKSAGHPAPRMEA